MLSSGVEGEVDWLVKSKPIMFPQIDSSFL